MIVRPLPSLLSILLAAILAGAVFAGPAAAQVAETGTNDPAAVDPTVDDPAADDPSYDDPYGEDPADRGPYPTPWLPEDDATDEPAEPEPADDPDELLPIRPVQFVPGREARLRTDGKAAIPRGAPKRVRRLIAAANAIVGKPYKWGGGHGRLIDRGYDCSGAVSYALIGGDLLGSVRNSGGFRHWGNAGPGRWVTTYSTRNHIYLEVAGLRLDTSNVGDWNGERGPRWRPVIGRRPNFHVRHPAGL